MSQTPQTPSDLVGVVQAELQKVLVYLREHPAVVKRVHETGPDAGIIEVSAPTIGGGTFDADGRVVSNEDSWLPVLPGSAIYRNMPPDVGDTVLVYYPDGVNTDRMFYRAQDPAEYVLRKVGEGLKVIFEYKDPAQHVAAIYFDKNEGQLVAEYGDAMVKHSADRVLTEVDGGSGTAIEQSANRIELRNSGTQAVFRADSATVESPAVQITAPTTTISGAVTVAGTLTAGVIATAAGAILDTVKAELEQLRSEYEDHTHAHGNGPGETEKPTAS